MESIPWVEKYRPNEFDNIVLSYENKKIFKTMIDTNYFPNMLFYGPPGTGKTTTIINLINEYQEKHNEKNKGLMIHLNASDDRGIDVIRNQINIFVNSKTLFGTGMKFIVLDEVDYMTKTAQQALKYVLQDCHSNVRICLICNYISKVDDSLQSEFVKFKFNNLPKPFVFDFIKNIIQLEKLEYEDEYIHHILEFYQSDIRSMINFIQSNHLNVNYKIVGNHLWKELYQSIVDKHDIDSISKQFYDISTYYCIDIKNIIKEFMYYVILQNTLTSDDIYQISEIIHYDIDNDTLIYNILIILLK
jgi:DNA polymerase III delta prime subunit